MNIREYIDSGVIEQYCLGTLSDPEMREVERMRDLFPEVGNELIAIEQALLQYVSIQPIAPPAGLKEKIWDTLENINKEFQIDLSDLPVINRFSDHGKWLGAVRPFIPHSIPEERSIKVLRQSESIVQALVISRTDFEDEIHVNEYESFIILEGECQCTIGDNVISLKPGGFLEIPLYTSHTVRITSSHVTAIVQRIAV